MTNPTQATRWVRTERDRPAFPDRRRHAGGVGPADRSRRRTRGRRRTRARRSGGSLRPRVGCAEARTAAARAAGACPVHSRRQVCLRCAWSVAFRKDYASRQPASSTPSRTIEELLNKACSGSETRLEDVQPSLGRRAVDIQRREHEQYTLLRVEQQPARATLFRHTLGIFFVANVHGDRQATHAKLRLLLERHLANTVCEIVAHALYLAQQTGLVPFDP